MLVTLITFVLGFTPVINCVPPLVLKGLEPVTCSPVPSLITLSSLISSVPARRSLGSSVFIFLVTTQSLEVGFLITVKLLSLPLAKETFQSIETFPDACAV